MDINTRLQKGKLDEIRSWGESFETGVKFENRLKFETKE